LAEWSAIYEQSPWDYLGLDKLASKISFYALKATGCIKNDSISYIDLLFKDSYASGTMSDSEFMGLSDDEKLQYLQYAKLSENQFNALSFDHQKAYHQQLSKNLKAVIS